MGKQMNIIGKLAADLKQLQQVAHEADLHDVRRKVTEGIAQARNSLDNYLDEFERANEKADQFTDPWVQKALSSKWTAAILLGLLACWYRSWHVNLRYIIKG